MSQNSTTTGAYQSEAQFFTQSLIQEPGYGFLFFLAIGIVFASVLASLWWIIFNVFISRKKHGDVKQWRERMLIRYNKSKLRLPIETFLATLALLSCAIFLYLASKVSELPGTVTNGDFNSDAYIAIFQQTWLIAIEFTISVIFTVDYFWNFLLHQYKFSYILSLYSVTDILTAANGYFGIITGTYFYGVEFLRIVRVYKYIVLLPRYTGEKFQGETLKVVLVVLRVFCFIFTFLGFNFVSENGIAFDGLIMTPLDALYFTIVTLSTVGYGDIYPKSITGKIIAMFMIVCGIVIFSIQIGVILTLLNERANRAHKPFKGKDHVVLVAHTSDGVVYWLTEFFHPDRNDQFQKVCVMIEDQNVDTETVRYLRSPEIEVRVDYIFGTPLITNDLERCKLSEAYHAFILIDKNVEDKTSEDAKTILEAYSMTRHAPDVPLSVQINRQKHQIALQSCMVPASTSFSVNQIKMGLISQSCLCPGLSTLVANLLQSYAPPDDKPLDDLSEYRIGLGNEVYVINNLTAFKGMTFYQAANIIFEKFEGLLIGLCIEDKETIFVKASSTYDERDFDIFNFTSKIAEEGVKQVLSNTLNQPVSRKLILNPGYKRNIDESDYGLIICQDEEILHQIENFDASTLTEKSEIIHDSKLSLELSPACIYTQDFESDYVAPNKFIDLSDATIDTVQETTISEHVLLIGEWADIVPFIQRLRSYPLKKHQQIVILTNSPPSEYDWQKLSEFPSIFYVQGTSTDMIDLQRAGIDVAENVVILGGEMSGKDVSSDAKPIMTYRLIKALKPFPFICINHTSNLQFLTSSQSDSELENPAYAAGQVYLSGSLDTLLCQTYFNEYIISMTEQFISGSVYQISIEKYLPSFNEKPALNLFQHLLKADLLLLGLYRKGNRRYVLMNPSPNVKIRLDDIAYVIGTREEEFEKLEEKEEKEEKEEVYDSKKRPFLLKEEEENESLNESKN